MGPTRTVRALIESRVARGAYATTVLWELRALDTDYLGSGTKAEPAPRGLRLSRGILDSRGNPAVEADVIPDSGVMGRLIRRIE